MKRFGKERVVKAAVSMSALLAGSISALIFFFLIYFSLPLISSGLMGNFLTSGWNPADNVFGIFPMIMGTIYIAGLALLWAAPIGIGLAAFIEVSAPGPLARVLRWTVEFMTGIPTVVYGFAALFLLVPVVREFFHSGSGLCILTASLMLGLMILPTIVGPSGSGKSTLLMAMNRLLETIPHARVEGKVMIRLNGSEFLDVRRLKDRDLPALRRRIGLIFQHPNVLPMSISKNVAFPLKLQGLLEREIEEKVRKALQEVHLWNEVKDRLKSPASELSGGQQQRLCLARVLVLEPEVL